MKKLSIIIPHYTESEQTIAHLLLNTAPQVEQ